MSIYVISTPDSYPNESTIFHQLFEHGLEILHIRKPHWEEGRIESFLQEIDPAWWKKIVLHGHINLVERYELRGIHEKPLGKEKKSSCYQLSASFHEVSELEGENQMYAYAFFSPVFSSISKEGYQPRFSFDQISKAVKKSPERVVALGGINRENTSLAKKMGFHGVATIGSVWQTIDPIQAFKDLQEEWDRKLL